MIKSFFNSLLVSLLIIPLGLQAAKPLKGQFIFLNGDSLTAEITKFDAKSIRIKHPYFLKECEIQTTNLVQVNLENSALKLDPNAVKAADLTTIKIKHRFKATNQNDTLKGSLAQNGDDFITLKTDYAGELKIEKDKILSIDIDTQNDLHYSGPKSLKEWHNTEHNQSWTGKNGAFYSGDAIGKISKKINTPNQILLSFDLAWKNRADFIMKIFSDNHEMSTPNNCYEMRIQHNYVYVYKTTDSNSRSLPANNRRIRPANDIRNALTNNKSAHFDLYLDKETGVIHIFVNGILFSTFKDPAPTPEKLGSALHLISTANIPLKVTNIKISQWNGQMPSQQDTDAFSELNGKGQRILLKNGDAVIGKTGAIKDGIMLVETKYGPLRIRVNGMRTIDLSESPEDSPLMSESDIKLYFKTGGWIILKPTSISNTKIKGFHQAFGEKEFDLNAFNRIDFHIYKPPFNLSRRDNNW